MGRPSEFSQDVADDICELLADGVSLREICEAETMPARSTVRRWREQNAEFRAQYARAREEQGHVYAERVVEVASTADDAALGRLEMDALKWAASKLAPRDYGDKLELNNNHGVQDSLAELLEKIDGRSRGLPG